MNIDHLVYKFLNCENRILYPIIFNFSKLSVSLVYISCGTISGKPRFLVNINHKHIFMLFVVKKLFIAIKIFNETVDFKSKNCRISTFLWNISKFPFSNVLLSMKFRCNSICIFDEPMTEKIPIYKSATIVQVNHYAKRTMYIYIK